MSAELGAGRQNHASLYDSFGWKGHEDSLSKYMIHGKNKAKLASKIHSQVCGVAGP